MNFGNYMLFEGGGAIKASSKIPSRLAGKIGEEVMSKIEDALGWQCALIGSAGKKADNEYNGDIDIAVRATFKDSKIAALKNAITSIFGKNIEFFESIGFRILSAGIPTIIEGSKKIVQVDFMFTPDIETAKFMFFSPDNRTNESKFGGMPRTELLDSIVNCIDLSDKKPVEYFNGEFNGQYDGEVKSYWKYTFVKGRGIYLKHKSYEGKKQMLANPRTIDDDTELVTSSPQKMVEMMFGDGVSVEDVNTFENIANLIISKKGIDQAKIIFDNFLSKHQFKNQQELKSRLEKHITDALAKYKKICEKKRIAVNAEMLSERLMQEFNHTGTIKSLNEKILDFDEIDDNESDSSSSEISSTASFDDISGIADKLMQAEELAKEARAHARKGKAPYLNYMKEFMHAPKDYKYDLIVKDVTYNIPIDLQEKLQSVSLIIEYIGDYTHMKNPKPKFILLKKSGYKHEVENQDDLIELAGRLIKHPEMIHFVRFMYSDNVIKKTGDSDYIKFLFDINGQEQYEKFYNAVVLDKIGTRRLGVKLPYKYVGLFIGSGRYDDDWQLKYVHFSIKIRNMSFDEIAYTDLMNSIRINFIEFINCDVATALLDKKTNVDDFQYVNCRMQSDATLDKMLAEKGINELNFVENENPDKKIDNYSSDTCTHKLEICGDNWKIVGRINVKGYDYFTNSTKKRYDIYIMLETTHQWSSSPGTYKVNKFFTFLNCPDLKICGKSYNHLISSMNESRQFYGNPYKTINEVLQELRNKRINNVLD